MASWNSTTPMAASSPAISSWSSRLSRRASRLSRRASRRSEEHTSELLSLRHLVCRLLLEKKNARAHLVHILHRQGVRSLTNRCGLHYDLALGIWRHDRTTPGVALSGEAGTSCYQARSARR